MTTLNLQVSTGNDDGHIDNVALSPNLTDNILNVGNVNGNTTSVAAVRFTGATVPNAATITSATLTVYGYSSYSTGSTISVIAACQNADDAAALAATTGNFNTTNRPRTTANSGGVNLASVTAGAAYTFDLTSSVQAVVNRAGWVSGNAIVVLLDNNGSSASEWQELESYNHSTTLAAKLQIVYSTGGGVQTVTPNVVASSVSVYSPTIVRGAVTVTPNAISSGATVYSPTIVTGSAIVPSRVESTAAVYNPTIQPGPVTVAPNAIGSTASVYNPTVAASVRVQPSRIESTATVFAPSIGSAFVDYNVLVGDGYTDGSPKQIVRTSADVLYVVAPNCDSYPDFSATGLTQTIRVHKANSAGVPTGFTRKDSSNEPAAVVGCAVALDSADNLRIVWAARSSLSLTRHLRYAVYNTATDTWGSPTTITSDLDFDDTGQGDETVAVAVDASDVVHVVYLGTAGSGTLTNRRVYYRNNSGGSWSAATQIDSGVTYTGNLKAWHPSIAFDGAGRIVVAWERGDFDNTNTGTIYSRVYSGGSWGSTVQVSAGGDSVLCGIDQCTSLLITPDGTYHTAYILYSGTNSQKFIRYRYSTDNGATWAGNNPTNQATHNPTLLWTGSKVRIVAHGTPDAGNHGENLYYFEGDGGSAAWGSWTLFVTGTNYDSSVNTRWAQYNHHFPHTIDVAYWNDNYPNVLYVGTEILAVGIAPARIESTAVVYSPTVQPGAVTVQPNVIASGATVYSPTVQPGAVAVQPTLLGSTATVYAPVVVAGAVAVLPARIESTAVVHSPVIVTGSAVQPARIESTASVYEPTVTPGPVTVSPGNLPSGAAVYSPTVVATIAVQPGRVESSVAVYSPTIQAGPVIVQPDRVESTAVVYDPFVGGGQVIGPTRIESTAQVFAPVIALGIVIAQPDRVESTVSVFAPVVVIGAMVVQPDRVESTAVVYSPAVATGGAILPERIESTATVYSPVIQPGGVIVQPEPVATTASVFEPVFVLGIGQYLQPDRIESTASVFAVAILTIAGSRVLRVAAENRTKNVAADSRTLSVTEE